MLSISTIISVCKGVKSGVSEDFIIENIITDSRIHGNENIVLFVAIVTDRSDGHNYITEAYKSGVRVFLVSKIINLESYPNSVFIQVADTMVALQNIASYVRQLYSIPVVGITGSNGKTIIKEWLYQLLNKEYNIVRSPKSYNSQIGVPLSVWQMNSKYTLGIFEAGISEPGEMINLESIIKPTIGVFTNIGEAHNQGFLNSKQKIEEKLLLFNHSDCLVYCKDYAELNETIIHFAQNLKKNINQELQLFSWSYKQQATVEIKTVSKVNGNTKIIAKYKGKEYNIIIPFTDGASIENAINCWCVMLHLKISEKEIMKGMATLQPIAMRLDLRQGLNNCIIINDSYNSDLTSLGIALDMLDQQKQHHSKTLILSDIQQTGRPELMLYTEVAALLKGREIKRFIGVGASLNCYKYIFEENKNMETFFFPSTEILLQNLDNFSFSNEAILLKGARKFAFENVGLVLEQKIHQTILTVNLTALHNNLEAFRRRLNKGVKTMAMVKASSYGTGGFEIAKVLQDAEIDYLTVAYVDEGVALRKANIKVPIMVMSPATNAFDRMIEWKLEPELFNFRSLKSFLEMARKIKVINYPVHLKLDTGMHRLGFLPNEIEELLSLIINEPTIRIASIFSHLAASDDIKHQDFTHHQGKLFILMSEQIIKGIGYRPLLHLCNTAGIVQYPQYHFDMVRLGLGLYGIDSSGALENQLQQISTLRTTIAQIKHVSAGETIGYSRKGLAIQDTKIATICIGYADGYPRCLGKSEAFVIINNKPAKLIGSIAMDMCMVDITSIDGVNEGDEVIIFGDALPIQQVAQWADTIAYEIMTGISQRVKRVYINES